MEGTLSLPDIKVRVVVDDTQLKNAPKAAHAAGAGIAAGAEKGAGGLGKLTGAISQVLGVAGLGGMPMVALKGEQALTSLSSTGISGMTLLGGAALAGVGLLAAGVEHSISSYKQLGEQVENFKRVSGASAQESGQMVQVVHMLGVESEVVATGMFRLSKAIDLTPKKLEALGVQIQRNSSGNIDLSATLFNVADAYNAAVDPATKNLILFDAFGRAGKEMIPVLEQGSTALKQLAKDAAMTFTPEDLDRLKETEIHQRQVTANWDSMWQKIGQSLIPVQDALSLSFLRGSFEEKRLNEMIKAGTITIDQASDARTRQTRAGEKLSAQIDKEFDASQKLSHAIDTQAQASRDLAKAEDDLWTKNDKLITQEEAQVNAGFALTLANLAVVESQGKVDQAHQRVTQSLDHVEKMQDAVTLAQQRYGKSSEEAKVAADDLRSAQLAANQTANDVTKAEIEQEKAYYAAAAAARKLQEDTDLTTTGHKDAKKEAEAYIEKLEEEAKTLAPGSPLRVHLDAYIATLRERIPKDIYTTIHVGLEGHAGKAIDDLLANAPGYAEGGRPPVGPIIKVGEKGPEWMQLEQPATVYPHGTAPPGVAGGDMSETNDLLRSLIDAVTADPSGQTGTEAALWKAMQSAGLNRIRGMAGA